MAQICVAAESSHVVGTVTDDGSCDNKCSRTEFFLSDV